jgi:hypothetical protein
MIDIKISVEGYDEAITKLKSAPRILARHLRRAMDKSVKTLQAVMQRYPPAPPSSSYRRTGTLGRRWVATASGYVGQIQGILANPTPYAPLVVGDEDQAWMHKGRWATVGQQAEKQKAKFAGFFQEGIDAAVKEMDTK